jgi:hypothetical protein
MKFNSTKRNVFLWSMVVLVTACIVFLVTKISTGDQYAIILAVIYPFFFGFIWYLPYQCRLWNVPLKYLPAVYFFSGTLLIILGCFSSTHLSGLHLHAEQWESIAEITPLILGAVVGGTYCCDAILGQEFDEKRYRVGLLGTLSGALSLLLILVLLRPGPIYPSLFLCITAAALSPSFATVIVGISDNKNYKIDRALLLFIAGVFLIFVTGFTAVWILPKIKELELNTTFLTSRDISNVLKNLVPSYCGAIGAGLITRGVEINVPPFCFETWAEKYLGGFKCVAVDRNKLVLEPVSPYRKCPVLEVVFELSDIDAMTMSSEKQRTYGKVLRDWLNTEWYRPSYSGLERVELNAPRAETLLEARN